MKYDNLRAFQRHLESSAPAHFSQVYLLIGEEPLDIQEAKSLLVDALLPVQSQHKTAVRSFEGEKLFLDSLLTELNTLSFLDDRKVVIIQHVEKIKKDELKEIESQLGKLSKSCFIVMTSLAFSKVSTFYKQTEKAGVVLDIPELKPWEKEKHYIEWTAKRVARTRKQMTYAAVQMLVKQIGANPLLLSQELDKILCYVGDRVEIGIEDVRAVAISSHVETVWELGEAIFGGNRRSALAMGHAILSDETVLLPLLRQLRGQFQTGFQVAGLILSGQGPEAVTAEYSHMKGRILEKHVQLSTQYGLARFRRGILAIDQAEFDSKNLQIDPMLLFEKLIIKLTETS